jgi:hypothetical protein
MEGRTEFSLEGKAVKAICYKASAPGKEKLAVCAEPTIEGDGQSIFIG